MKKENEAAIKYSVKKALIDALNDKFECTFYFIINAESETVVLKKDILYKVCKKMADFLEVQSYVVRSGASIRHTDVLKEEFSNKSPFEIKIVYIDSDADEISLLSQQQRDLFLDYVMETEQDEDTLPIIKRVLKETEGISD